MTGCARTGRADRPDPPPRLQHPDPIAPTEESRKPTTTITGDDFINQLDTVIRRFAMEGIHGHDDVKTVVVHLRGPSSAI